MFFNKKCVTNLSNQTDLLNRFYDNLRNWYDFSVISPNYHISLTELSTIMII